VDPNICTSAHPLHALHCAVVPHLRSFFFS
jgi:hypothetical protein